MISDFWLLILNFFSVLYFFSTVPYMCYSFSLLYFFCAERYSMLYSCSHIFQRSVLAHLPLPFTPIHFQKILLFWLHLLINTHSNTHE